MPTSPDLWVPITALSRRRKVLGGVIVALASSRRAFANVVRTVGTGRRHTALTHRL